MEVIRPEYRKALEGLGLTCLNSGQREEIFIDVGATDGLMAYKAAGKKHSYAFTKPGSTDIVQSFTVALNAHNEYRLREVYQIVAGHIPSFFDQRFYEIGLPKEEQIQIFKFVETAIKNDKEIDDEVKALVEPSGFIFAGVERIAGGVKYNKVHWRYKNLALTSHLHNGDEHLAFYKYDGESWILLGTIESKFEHNSHFYYQAYSYFHSSQPYALASSGSHYRNDSFGDVQKWLFKSSNLNLSAHEEMIMTPSLDLFIQKKDRDHP